MFILTLSGNKPQEILKGLQEICKEIEKDSYVTELGELGVLKCGQDYEFEVLPEQKFVCMGSWLHFDETGNKLKLPDNY